MPTAAIQVKGTDTESLISWPVAAVYIVFIRTPMCSQLLGFLMHVAVG